MAVNPQSDAVKPPISDDKPLLPHGTYVIQIPKDQIYRIPPPQNSLKLQKLANRKPRRSCRCCRYTLAVIFILFLLLSISTAVFYFLYRPQKLIYSIDTIAVGGFNLTSSSPFSPRVTLGIASRNPNDHLSVFYIKKGSSVNVYYDGVSLCDSEMPAFQQPKNNVTVIQTVLKGSDIVLARDVHSRLVKQEKGRNVPLELKVKAPVKVKVGGVKTWEMTVSVKCDVSVDRLTQKSKIVSESCGYRVKLW